MARGGDENKDRMGHASMKKRQSSAEPKSISKAAHLPGRQQSFPLSTFERTVNTVCELKPTKKRHRESRYIAVPLCTYIEPMEATRNTRPHQLAIMYILANMHDPGERIKPQVEAILEQGVRQAYLCRAPRVGCYS